MEHALVSTRLVSAAPQWSPSHDDRLARLAARRAFVEMKNCFMRAAAAVEGPDAAMLQRKVRLADEVVELWRLRHAVLTALPLDAAHAEMHRRELQQQLDSAFPEESGLL